MRLNTRPDSAPDDSGIITKAALRAAERLGVKNNVLARIVGVSEPTISRMRKGSYVLEQGQKPFELAILFVRFYRSLDAMVGGDDAVAADWLRNRNIALDAAPIDLIQSVAGLTNAIAYLDSRRAVA